MKKRRQKLEKEQKDRVKKEKKEKDKEEGGGAEDASNEKKTEEETAVDPLAEHQESLDALPKVLFLFLFYNTINTSGDG